MHVSCGVRIYCYFVTVIVILFLCRYNSAAENDQERAKLLYANPKYVENVTVFTARQKRGEPYKTNITATTLHTWGNNVSFTFRIEFANGADFVISKKVCEVFEMSWLENFLMTYATEKFKCPVTARSIGFLNIDLPPKGMPMQLPSGDYKLFLKIFMTETKEKIAEGRVALHCSAKTCT